MQSNIVQPGYALGLANRHYANNIDSLWGYNGGTMGYISNYVYSLKINIIFSLTLNVGTIDGRPPRIDSLDKELLTVITPKLTK